MNNAVQLKFGASNFNRMSVLQKQEKAVLKEKIEQTIALYSIW